MKIAIASGKGGTGKTTLSTNLASYLAKKRNVVLVDLDVEEPNSGLFINGRTIVEEDKYKMIPRWNQDTCSLCGQCQKICNFNAIIKILDSVISLPGIGNVVKFVSSHKCIKNICSNHRKEGNTYFNIRKSFGVQFRLQYVINRGKTLSLASCGTCSDISYPVFRIKKLAFEIFQHSHLSLYFLLNNSNSYSI